MRYAFSTSIVLWPSVLAMGKTDVDSEKKATSYQCGDSNVFLPLGGDWEAGWPRGVKILLYGLGLAWCFLGVAIVSDVFMTAIETITSKKRRIFDKKRQRHRTIKIWNETIANLTLMALGSSAPEILLNVVEVGQNKMFAGRLGPGTIVGSAAFNLLCISAVCVMAVPSGELRLIKDVSVYVVTAMFSLFAYLWLIIILIANSKDVVTVLEAVATFLLFPVLVFVSFCADKGWLSGQPATAQRQRILAAEMTREELAEIVRCIKEEFGEIDDDTIAILVERRTARRPSMATYRSDKKLGKQKHQPTPCCGAGHVASSNSTGTANWTSEEPEDFSPRVRAKSSTATPQGQATIEWAVSNYAVRECDQKINVEVRRYDDTTNHVTCNYRTKNGSAIAGDDFLHTQGVVQFRPNEMSKKIPVTILDDEVWEGAEDFYVELFDAQCDRGSVQLGNQYVTCVTIIDDDDPGCLAFEKECIQLDADVCPQANVRVLRKYGSKGEIRCKYMTEDDSAVAPLDYEALQDTLIMQPGEITHDIPVVVHSRGRYDTTEKFRLILYDPETCRFDATTDGDELQNICTIELKASDRTKATLDRMAMALAMNWDKARIGRSNWKEQFRSVWYVGGSKEDHIEARIIDWCFHAVSFPWRLIFATVPPPDFGGGWWCFGVALLHIGCLTAVIGDLAILFGCGLDFPDEIIAITFVALGTSLPDTFASKTAAIQDPYADASITNITGSNSVNVFLGLGLPWTVASVYWWFNGQTEEWKEKAPEHVLSTYSDGSAVYVIKAESLAFSVGVFTACAICAMAALLLRRKLFGGELGGPLVPKIAAAVYLVTLWIVYVAASWIYIDLRDRDR